jgi:hypothetical protein
MLIRDARSMCSAGWPKPRSVASDSDTIRSLSFTPDEATDGM